VSGNGEEELQSAGTSANGGEPYDRVSLDGWTLRDHSSGTWSLTGSLAAGQSCVFRPDRQAMSLNDAGDEVTLIDATSTERDRFAYAATSEGVEVLTGHWRHESARAARHRIRLRPTSCSPPTNRQPGPRGSAHQASGAGPHACTR